jgi:c-di-GMP-binding flagellar brake protein YcgR
VTEPATGGSPEQRREAVRAQVRVPLTFLLAGARVHGETTDVSEGGASLVVHDGPGPDAGTVVELELAFDSGRVWLDAEVVRVTWRNRRPVVFVRFLDLGERDSDAVRREVFAALRRRRARGLW